MYAPYPPPKMAIRVSYIPNHHQEKAVNLPSQQQIEAQPYIENQSFRYKKKPEISDNTLEDNKQSISPDGQVDHRKNKKFVKSDHQIKQQVRRWNKQRKLLKDRRQRLDAYMQHKIERSFSEIKELKRKMEEEKKIKRQQQINDNVIKINKRRKMREQSLKKHFDSLHAKRSSSVKSLPLYKHIENKYTEHLIQEEELAKRKIQKRRQQMNLDLLQIKRHEQEYMKHIKEKLKKKPAKDDKSEINSKQSFKKEDFDLYCINPQQKQKNIDKLLRRKKFQEKVRMRPLITDQQKLIQIQIAKDKAKNPLKYNYLSQVAALSDQKIFDQFKDFDMKLDAKEIGNQYMRNMIQQAKQQSRIISLSRVSKSTPHFQNNSASVNKKVYKNYIPTLKPLLKKSENPLDREIKQVLANNERMSKIKEGLHKKSVMYEDLAISQFQQINSESKYDEIIQQEGSVDDKYLMALKLKIAEAEIE